MSQFRKFIKKKESSLRPCIFKIGQSFQSEAEQEDPQINLKDCLTIILYNKMRQIINKEKVQLSGDMRFTVSISMKDIFYYNYQIGTQIEFELRKFTYVREVDLFVDEWNKQTLAIIFKIPKLPEELLLSFSVQYGENELPQFVKKIELQKRQEQYQSIEQISLGAKFIILKFSNMSINDKEDSFAELTISLEKIHHQTNYYIFCPESDDLTHIFRQLQEKTLVKITDMESPLFECQFYRINFSEECQEQVNQIQNTLYQPIKKGKQKNLIATQINQRECKSEEEQMVQSANCLIYSYKERQNKIKEILAQHHKLNEEIIRNSEGHLLRLQNFVSGKKESKSEQLNLLINEFQAIAKQFLDKINLNETIKSYNTKIQSQNKKNQDLTETLLCLEEKTKQMQSTIKKLAEENKQLEDNQQNQNLVTEIQQLYKILKQNTEKVKEQNEKIASLEQDFANLENDLQLLQKQNSELQIQNSEQSQQIQYLQQTIEKQVQSQLQLIQKTKLQKDLIKCFNQKIQTQAPLYNSHNQPSIQSNSSVKFPCLNTKL